MRKPGYKSTEFWMVMMFDLMVAFGVDVQPDLKAQLIAGVTAAYTLARNIDKAFGKE